MRKEWDEIPQKKNRWGQKQSFMERSGEKLETTGPWWQKKMKMEGLKWLFSYFIFQIEGGQVGSKKTETDNEKLEESNNFSDNQTKVTIEHSKNGFHLPEIDRGKHKKGKNSWIIFYYFVCFLLKTFSVFFRNRRGVDAAFMRPKMSIVSIFQSRD